MFIQETAVCGLLTYAHTGNSGIWPTCLMLIQETAVFGIYIYMFIQETAVFGPLTYAARKQLQALFSDITEISQPIFVE